MIRLLRVHDGDIRADGRHRGQALASERAVDETDARVELRQIAPEIATQHTERQAGRARGISCRHAGMRVLLELERHRPVVFNRIAEAVQRADSGVAAPGERQLPRGAGADQLVVDDVRRHPHEGEVPASLPDDLVAGGERNEVGEPLERNDVPVPDIFADCLSKLNDFGHTGAIVPHTPFVIRDS